jgi:hypothetical protein
MSARTRRLAKLLTLQQKVTAFHEMRLAGFAAEAAQAAAEASRVLEMRDGPESLAGVFPEVYLQSAARAIVRQEASAAAAKQETARVALESARTGLVEQSWRQARRQDERAAGEVEGLELLVRRLPRP